MKFIKMWNPDYPDRKFELQFVTRTPGGISIQSINPMDMHAVIPAVIGGLNHNIIIADDIEIKEPEFSINRNPFYPRSYASKDTIELVNSILFQKQKQPKENHPYGWYRKFEKKRF